MEWSCPRLSLSIIGHAPRMRMAGWEILQDFAHYPLPSCRWFDAFGWATGRESRLKNPVSGILKGSRPDLEHSPNGLVEQKPIVSCPSVCASNDVKKNLIS